MQKPKKLIRTTLGEFFKDIPYSGSGVYVIACYPSLGCLYVGISNDVGNRLMQHSKSDSPLGHFLRNTMADAYGFRLDILVQPDDCTREWCIEAERELIAELKPVYNVQHAA